MILSILPGSVWIGRYATMNIYTHIAKWHREEKAEAEALSGVIEILNPLKMRVYSNRWVGKSNNAFLRKSMRPRCPELVFAECILDIKGHQSEGKRYIPLTKTAKFIIEQARKINPNSEYIFIKDGKPIVTSTFNRRLKKCCDHLGIEYRSSHKVRFSTASILNKNGVEAIELQKMLGHTTLTMTNHYLRNVTPVLETIKKMAEIFG